VLCGAFIALGIAIWATSTMFRVIPFLGFLSVLVQTPWLLVCVLFVAINVVGMVKAYRGKLYRFPYAAEIAEKYL
jgi:uncharacterized membrane protein